MHSSIQATTFPEKSKSLAPSQAHGIWLAGAVLLAMLWIVSTQLFSFVQFFYASVLLAISIQSYLSWRRERNIRIPAWAFVCAAHFVFYGLAIFGALRESPSIFDHGSDLPEPVITEAMLLGIVGLLSMWAGRTMVMHFAKGKSLRLSFVEMNITTPVRIHALLVLGIATNVFGVPFFGTVLWNVSVVAFNTLPLAAFLWLAIARRVRGLNQLDWLLALAFLATRVISGARFNASLGTIVVPLLLIGVADISLNRKLSWKMIALAACMIVFLQPGKGAIRREMNRGRVGEGMTDALAKWADVSVSGWSDVFAGRTPLAEQLSATASRSSLLTMTGLILEKTPERVPYQLGTEYPLLVENLIPRVLWPEKPSVNVANQFFQVQYGLTDVRHLQQVSIACGFEAEGYMNFGWAGVLAVGFLVGAALGIYELAFFPAGGGLTAAAIGLALLPGFLMIESQLVQYLGGILQLVFAAGIVFHQSKDKRSSGTRGAPARRVSGAVFAL
jgi:hypothetical protein